MRTRTKNNLLFWLLIWSVYSPIVMMLWHYLGNELIQLAIVLLVGLLGVIIGYLVSDKRTSYRPIRLSRGPFRQDDNVAFRKLFSGGVRQ